MHDVQTMQIRYSFDNSVNEELCFDQIRHPCLVLLVQVLLEITSLHMLKQDVKLQFPLLSLVSSLLCPLEEVHRFDNARVVQLPLHFKLTEHVCKFFHRERIIVEHLALLYYTNHWLQNIWSVNLS